MSDHMTISQVVAKKVQINYIQLNNEWVWLFPDSLFMLLNKN